MSDDPRESARELRAARWTLDAEQIAHLVTDPRVSARLQLAGEAVLALLEDDRGTASEPAKTLAGRLTDRGWRGDAQLADLLIELPEGRTSQRRRVPADLEQLAGVLEGSSGLGYGGVLDCDTGDVWPADVLDDWAGEGEAPDPEREPDRYIDIPETGSRAGWMDMADFAASVEDDRVREQRLDAIEGRGAFSRFRRVIERHDDLWSLWHEFSDERRTGRGRDWLDAMGLAALPVKPYSA